MADATRPLRRIRWVLWFLTAVWCFFTAVSVYGAVTMDLPAPPGEVPPPEWVTYVIPGGLAVLCAAAGVTLKPGSKTGWGLAVAAAAINLMSCTLPLGVVLLVWLFQKPVKESMLGGGFIGPPR